MSFKGTVRLETDRLILRKYALSDALYMYTNWTCDSRVTRFLRWLPHESVDETEKIIKELFLPAYNDGRRMEWVIELKSTGQPIGDVSIDGDTGELGYCLGCDF